MEPQLQGLSASTPNRPLSRAMVLIALALLVSSIAAQQQGGGASVWLEPRRLQDSQDHLVQQLGFSFRHYYYYFSSTRPQIQRARYHQHAPPSENHLLGFSCFIFI
ncbi:hypothetical protein RchiOBHm_Chr6g0291171 [Rosa chinensis]|uniref:Uncharacterized protein n=1 Tax=Rosa chinensis TaxID=74649 RepID=A0A2P6PW11_ROSCH|nr:hypothetical protein RchiOBHm_Chr6g0291171 [Rosa chinensis]